MKIEITEKKVIDVTPKTLAQIFFEMTSNQQRDFFEHVASYFDGRDFDNQMYHVVSDDMSEEAKEIMRIIGKAAS